MSMFLKAPMLDGDFQRSTSTSVLKVGVAAITGFSVALFSSGLMLQRPSAVESTSLLTMPAPNLAMKANSMTLHNLPGSGVFKEATLKGLQTLNTCNRDVHVNAVKEALSPSNKSRAQEIAVRAEAALEELPTVTGKSYLKAGATPPLGFWDPVGLSTTITEGRLLFFREAELKHGRVCMLAFLGQVVQENQPIAFGGYDGPAVDLFPFVRNVPLADFWPLACIQTFAAIAALEFTKGYDVLEGLAFDGLIDNKSPDWWAAKTGRVPGNYGYDPLGLKPKTDEAFLDMQNKEINNGRLAMLAAFGVMIQEAVTGEKTFG